VVTGIQSAADSPSRSARAVVQHVYATASLAGSSAGGSGPLARANFKICIYFRSRCSLSLWGGAGVGVGCSAEPAGAW
jgi:hypothetical protein